MLMFKGAQEKYDDLPDMYDDMQEMYMISRICMVIWRICMPMAWMDLPHRPACSMEWVHISQKCKPLKFSCHKWDLGSTGPQEISLVYTLSIFCWSKVSNKMFSPLSLVGASGTLLTNVTLSNAVVTKKRRTIKRIYQ